MASNQLAKLVWYKFILDKKTFGSVLDKIKLVSASDGRSTAEFTVAEEHSNSFGTLHGGLTATIVDCLSSVALASHKRQATGVSVDLHITYIKGAPIGEEVIIESNTIRAGKTLAYLEVYLKRKKDGTVLAKGSHTKFVGNEIGGISIEDRKRE